MGNAGRGALSYQRRLWLGARAQRCCRRHCHSRHCRYRHTDQGIPVAPAHELSYQAPMTAIRLAAAAALVSLFGCAGDPAPAATPPSTVVPDDRFVVGGRTWYLQGNALTSGHDQLDLTVWVPQGTRFVDAWLDENPGVRLVFSEGTFVLRQSIADLTANFEIGAHRLRLAANGSATAFADIEIYRSHPLYAVLATDWDFSDPGDGPLTAQDALHADFPSLKITHFVGPYTFTDPALTQDRVGELVTWLKAQAAQGDEIGLHIHPYCNFVTHAGVACITDQSVVYAAGDASGYTINLSAYSRADMSELLASADALFAAAGLGKPTSFRAGGWTANADTLAALADGGYVVDSSANNWARMEEWEGVQNGVLYQWNQDHWNPIGDASQPYYPNASDAASAEVPTLDLLEVPDNAIMVDYVTVDEMTAILATNWPSATALTTPATFVFGFHPAPSAGPGSADITRLRGIVTELGQHLAATGNGPIVYETMSNLAALAW